MKRAFWRVLASRNKVEEKGPVPPAARSMRRVTVSRKVTLIGALIITVCFTAIVTDSIVSQRAALLAQGERSFKTITNLLGNNVAGGLQWNKAKSVEKAYGDFVHTDGSEIANILTFNRDGETVTEYASEHHASFDLSSAPEWAASMEGEEKAYIAHSQDHIVVVVAPLGKKGNPVGLLAVAWSLDTLNATVLSVLTEQIVVAVVAMLVLVAILAATMKRMVGIPLASMTSAMRHLADGKLETRVPAQDKRDDIGEMARAVEVFKQNAIEIKRLEEEKTANKAEAEALQRRTMNDLADAFEASVSAVADNVANSAGAMKTAADASSSTASTTKKMAGTVQTVSQEASHKMQAVATAADQLANAVAEIGRQVVDSTRVSTEAVNQAEQTNKNVEGLSVSANKIGDVIKLISDIAQQTNLLALNATIEAARAGEAGKGFAVVAGEVKNLAAQTAAATVDISQQVSSIQSATTDAVDAIKEIVETISAVSSTISMIATAVEQQGDATREINLNVHNAASGTGEVSKIIAQMNVSAETTVASSEGVLVDAENLAHHADTLREQVSDFLNNVRAA